MDSSMRSKIIQGWKLKFFSKKQQISAKNKHGVKIYPSILFHLSVSGSLEPIPASIGREAGYIQVASLSQARGEHANSAWAGKQDYISHIAPLSHIQWWLYQAHPAVPTTEFLTSVKESLEMEWFSWTGLTDLFHLGRLYLVEVPGTRFSFCTYSAGIPSDLRWFKNVMSCHRLASRWHHSISHESISFTKTKTAIFKDLAMREIATDKKQHWDRVKQSRYWCKRALRRKEADGVRVCLQALLPSLSFFFSLFLRLSIDATSDFRVM